MFKASLHVVLALTIVGQPGITAGCGCGAAGAASADVEGGAAERKCCGQGRCGGCCSPSAQTIPPAPTERSCCHRTHPPAPASAGADRLGVSCPSCACLPGSLTSAPPVERSKSPTEDSAPKAAAVPAQGASWYQVPIARVSRTALDRRKSRSRALERCVELGRFLI